MKYILLICLLCLFGCEQDKPFTPGETVYCVYTHQIGVLLEIDDKTTVPGNWHVSYPVKIKIKYIKEDNTEDTKILNTTLDAIKHYQEPKAEK